MVRNTRRLLTVLLVSTLATFFWCIRNRTKQSISPTFDSHRESQEVLPGAPSHERLPFYPGTVKPAGSNYSRIVVIPKLRSEDVGWIIEGLPGLQTAIYEVDNPSVGQFRVPKNKGREAMAYLTYIIDHYEALPDTVIFVHSHKMAWHNNILLDLDTPTTIQHLRDDRVARHGYMNLRCHLDPGCPNWIHLDRAEVDYDSHIKPEEKHFSFELFQTIFPGHRPPPVLSQACCAQFAVSSERIRDNPRSMYEHIRNWLLETPIEDKYSGRILEYMWQYLFTRNAEYCPSMNSCYCDGFGICFGSARILDNWLKKLRSWELAEEDLHAAEGENKDQIKIAELRDRVGRLNSELNEEKAEAFRRGEDEKNRLIERERT
ncbi:hypothetical protein B0J11DRAFT_526036 [Dendryphion nanum]|uniref:Uncharacterized protein n=1 Tax=Dendryphion nanum TaxID=256645 RepID=A0A9P9IPJ9_9PLEO|nr:hypothetical protein B0J11DRAFT_526036 [Dendryphion nanum]